jgi:NAD(P)-dependent dehydrogenase (short-subunit alcohol dehydrogenase family)
VLLNGRNPEPLGSLAEAIHQEGGKAVAMPFDIRDESACVDAVLQIQMEYGRLDCLVNNAYGGRGGSAQTAKHGDYMEAYDLCVASPARLVQLCLPLLKLGAEHGNGGSSIVNIASMYGLVSPDLRVYDDALSSNPPFYGAAKGGLIQLTRYLACELGVFNIRVNAVAPGPFPSPAAQASAPQLVERLIPKVPLGRMGEPVEVAGPVLFLCSAASAYVNGAVLPVDGGWTAW